MSAGDYEAFLAKMRQRESGNDYAAYNTLHFAGAYQMGKAALITAGFVVDPRGPRPKRGQYVTDNDWKTAEWTDKAKSLGVNSIADFLGAKAEENGLPKYEEYYPMVWDAKEKKKVPGKQKKMRIALEPSKADTAKKAQDEAIKAMDKVIWRSICAMKLDSYVGVEIKGIKLTPSALIAGYHLGGTGYHTNSDGSRQGGLEAYLRTNGKEDGKEDYGTHISEVIAIFNDYDVPFQKMEHKPTALSVAKPRTNTKKVKKGADNGLEHPHSAETSAWYQQDYYNTKHWNIASRLYGLSRHDDSNDGWPG
jgi:hypothetical protein